MNRPLPPLAWFRAFESAARHLNFTHAAQELLLTQSAVSQHIRSLESRLGCALFVRQHRKLSLTDEGRRLLPSVRKAMEQLRDATQVFESEPGKNLLTVSVSASIAQWYIVPGLQEFLDQHPGLEIRLISKIWPDEFSAGSADVEIRFDSPASAENRFELLFPDSIVLVAADGSSNQNSVPSLIGVAGTNDTWNNWFDNPYLEKPQPLRLTVESHGMAVDCACAGVGVALTSFSIAAAAINDGKLKLADTKFKPAIDGYYASISYGENADVASHFVRWIGDRISGAKLRALDKTFGIAK